MRRLFWLALGGTLGALIMRKLSRAAAKLTPRGLARNMSDGLLDLADAVRDFATEVRTTMSTREAELRAATGLDGAAGTDRAAGPAGEAVSTETGHGIS